jgi:hypothetical protein
MVLFVWAASDLTAVKAISYGSEYSLIWILVGMIVATALTLNKKHTSYSVWYLTTWISYTRMFGLINTDLDTSTLFFFSKVSKGLHGVQIITHYERKTSNDRFNALGYSSYHFFNNAEKFLIIFFGCITLNLLMLIFGFCYQSIRNLKEKSFLNMMQRSVLICSFDFFLFGFQQIYNINMNSTYDTLSSLFAVMMIALCIVFIIYLPIHIKGKILDSTEEIQDSTLLFEFKWKEGYNCYYYLLFIVTRMISAIFLIFCQDYPEVQVSFLGICGLAHVTFLLKFRPFREEFSNYIVTTCEIIQLLIIISISCYLAHISESASYILRWLIIISFWFGIIFAFLRFLYNMLKKDAMTSPQPPQVEPEVKHQRDNSQTDLMSHEPGKLDVTRIEDLEKSSNLSSRNQNLLYPGPFNNSRVNSRQSSSHSIASSQRTFKSSQKMNLNEISTKKAKPELPVIEDLEEEEIRITNNEKTPQSSKPLDEPVINHYSGIDYYPRLVRKYTKDLKINK